MALTPVSNVRTPAYIDHQRRISALAGRVRELRIETFESATSEILSQELQPKTTTLLEQANQLVHTVLDAYARPEKDIEFVTAPKSTDAIAPEPKSDAALARIADVAFMAHVDLRQRAARVASLRGNGTNVFVTECDGALRRVLKALSALDEAIARASNSATSLDFRSDLDLSLRVRATYARFRAKVLAASGGADEGDGETRLRRACYEIATLMGSPIYPSFRIHDRIQFRSLQQRIVSWASVMPRDAAEGQFLWSDVCAFAEILRDVNRRQELCDHDSRIVLHAVDALADVEGTDLSAKMLADLRTLEGRDDELDSLVTMGGSDVASWAPVVLRLASESGLLRKEAANFR